MDVEEIIAGVHAYRGRYWEICERAGVSYSWLTKLATDQIEEPGLHKMNRLKAALEQMQREDAAA